ncbi:KCNH6 [Symbiodinium necroappetens]|uniref:KCNH6 protein n=1 Tax=Symbiodinium necroappetens TaxID=1628268 RepID=A0A812L6Y4_9DINO|nr:KCNH6 [Symbiodinium necroappetens]
MANRWENLLLELTDELHRLSAKLQVLELENQKLKEPTAPDANSQAFVRAPSPDDCPPELLASASRRASSSSSGSASANHLSGSLPLNIRGTASASATLLEEPAPRNGTEVDVLKPTSSLRSDAAETMPTFSAVTEDLGTGSRASALIKEERMQFMIMRAQKTKNFVALKPWYIINPDSSGLANTWQLLTMFALAFVGLVTPVQVGLLKVEFGLLTVLSLAVDLVYVIDMVLQFFTSYPRRRGREVEWEVRLPRITIHYLKTWFILDFVTLIPFDIIALTSGVDDVKELNGVKAIRVLRLVKLFRVLKTSKFTQKYEIPYSIPYQQVTLFKFLLMLILVCHWLACVWALTLQLVSSDLPQWIAACLQSAILV